ncbi:paraquat-inducible protein A [Sulfitobacter delicatus]|jgi:paraquat-inducible protein A|uniref:Paraquat-inducible protein A n=1 Tax=Sulfitobacter delicatus TaxID=218672 RepID=A0A1G7JBE1_9RHOB|nr:paraquat-inducible protein A [Sulfitobacter delicatus]SDF21789.1 paraquat-inducible protein A [Sulfitobacter delicatus]
MDHAATPLADLPLDELIVCPQCDATYRLRRPKHGERATCSRCHTALITPRRNAGLQIIAVALAVLVLILGATVFPFLRIDAAGTSNAVSILDAALAFGGPMILLSLATAALIVFIPLLRVMLTLYVLIPVVLDRPPARHAIPAFRLSEGLRPWSMAEVFAIGCAVALVKVADLADVEFGPAFYMFGALVVLVIAQDRFLCKWSVWQSLEHPKKS